MQAARAKKVDHFLKSRQRIRSEFRETLFDGSEAFFFAVAGFGKKFVG